MRGGGVDPLLRKNFFLYIAIKTHGSRRKKSPKTIFFDVFFGGRSEVYGHVRKYVFLRITVLNFAPALTLPVILKVRDTLH